MILSCCVALLQLILIRLNLTRDSISFFVDTSIIILNSSFYSRRISLFEYCTARNSHRPIHSNHRPSSAKDIYYYCSRSTIRHSSYTYRSCGRNSRPSRCPLRNILPTLLSNICKIFEFNFKRIYKIFMDIIDVLVGNS